MTLVLENEHCRVTFMERAGQIEHFIDKDKDVELMYQGDQGWSGRNPTLFPIVGNTWSKDYTIQHKTYAMKNHGLIRYLDLQGKQEENAVIFTLDSNEETLKQYPFSFHYEMKYTLEGKKLHIAYAITNTGDQVMPFSFGLHPAFRIPQYKNETFEEYSFDFEVDEHAHQFVMDPQGNVPHTYKDVHFKKWQFNRKEIEDAATIIYKDLRSSYLTVCHKEEPRIRFAFDQFELLAIWTHPTTSDFICIEPWIGHADLEPGHEDFYTREGTRILKPQEVFEISYAFEAL